MVFRLSAHVAFKCAQVRVSVCVCVCVCVCVAVCVCVCVCVCLLVLYEMLSIPVRSSHAGGQPEYSCTSMLRMRAPHSSRDVGSTALFCVYTPMLCWRCASASIPTAGLPLVVPAPRVSVVACNCGATTHMSMVIHPHIRRRSLRGPRGAT